MKTFNKGFIAGLLSAVLVLSMVGTAFAATVRKSIEVEYGISLKIDGETPEFKDVNGAVVEPFVYNGTTYVPIRGAADWLYAYVGYDANSNSATIASIVPELDLSAEMMDVYHELYTICIDLDEACVTLDLGITAAQRGDTDAVLECIDMAGGQRTRCINSLNTVIERVNQMIEYDQYAKALEPAMIICESIKEGLTELGNAFMPLAKYASNEGDKHASEALDFIYSARSLLLKERYNCDSAFNTFYKQYMSW